MLEQLDTVDGKNSAPVEGTVVYPTILKGFSTIPGGDRRISEPSTVAHGKCDRRTSPTFRCPPHRDSPCIELRDDKGGHF